MDPSGNNKPSGKGRGSFLLEMMRQRAQMERSQALSHSLETPSVSSAEQTSRSSEEYSSHASSSSGGRGRAQISGWLKSLSSSSSEESRNSSLAIGHGRGALPGLIRTFG